MIGGGGGAFPLLMFSSVYMAMYCLGGSGSVLTPGAGAGGPASEGGTPCGPDGVPPGSTAGFISPGGPLKGPNPNCI